METMIEKIQSDVRFKKSLKIAEALALDYKEFTTSDAKAMTSLCEPRRRKRNGEPGDTGVFIRTQAFKISWYIFFTRKSANEFVNASKDLLDKNDIVRLSSIKPIDLDRGVLETLNFLKERGSSLTHTKLTFKLIEARLKFGL